MSAIGGEVLKQFEKALIDKVALKPEFANLSAMSGEEPEPGTAGQSV